MKRYLPYPGRRLQGIWTVYQARRVFMQVSVGSCLLFFLTAFALAQEFEFPLRAPEGTHHLEDSQGRPFLISGDSAWSLIADLSLSDAVLYLETRKRQGFNTILTSLIEHKFARNAPANSSGDAPFLGTAFETPNEAYFEKAEAIIKAASRRNLLVLLYPAYLGAGGGPEGWYQEMVSAGPEKLKDYGRYVARRFAAYPNIIWVQGGDYDPPDKALVTAVAEGIAEVTPDALQTVHTNRDTVSSVYWQGADWLDIDTVYTYGDVAEAVLARYRSGPQRPFFLLEGKYEGEHGVNEREVRLIAYSALLSGAGGQMFGNNPIWHFSAPGLQPASETWEQALFSRGAQSLMQLGKLFAELDWWKLVPDQGLLLKAAEGGEHHRALAARDTDGSFAMIYVIDADNITIDLGSLPGGEKLLRWYDPSSGVFAEDAEPLGGDPVKKVAVPDATNSSGFRDWVAILSNNF
ncbi:Putative collagen-binding domain of a collagenase [Xaviernesmea oryzae]|uniref:Putative collagen-binding domain of a collagenase n=1 Tax=Xaviernesmea oryzae TaxID=464029 RepID=A0A1X7FIG4_9HYPH|nr:DUF4038 domain-containing protein [Xaviernesmea oryzae]SMF52788.1 Putative collagen-binding domain of a collagenase [Xaviernesmea oryzae]